MADETPHFSKNDFKAIVLEHDKDHYKDEDVYEFSNGRKFKNTDRYGNGIYS